MKKIILGMAAILIMASCSSPKYAYYFDHHDYQAGKRKQAVDQKNTQGGLETIPVGPQQEDLVLASAGSDLSSMNSHRSAMSKEKKEIQTSLTKVQRKELRKRLFGAIKSYKKDMKKSSPDATAGGDKNQVVALILAIFLGFLGIHRFYLGRIGTALLQVLLLVLGLFLVIPLYALAIWVLIDIILIAMGSLTPKGGSYNPSF